MTKKQKKILTRIIIASAIIIALAFIPLKEEIKAYLYLIPYIIIGYDILIRAVKGIFKGRAFDENFLMAVATVGAFLLGEYVEGAAVMLFYQIGEFFQSYAIGKSRKNITKLMDIRPDYANIENPDGIIVKVDPCEVNIGTVITVKVGEKIPIDGVIVEGSTSLDTVALTGESIPTEVTIGSEVLSGSINLTGVIKIKTTKLFGESTASKILDLMENASSKKSTSENFISKFAKYYTPVVCFGALAVALFPPLIRIILGYNGEWNIWIYRALSFLVISCPCALVLSIPLSFFATIGGASKSGILIKGSNSIESMAKIKCVVFDKTGTMTKGVFKVIGIHHNKLEAEKILEYAAHAESFSNHPISKCIIEAYGKEIDNSRIKNIKEISGHGVTAEIDGKVTAVGNERLMYSIGVTPVKCSHTGTVIHVAIDGEYSGHILISDIIKPQAKNTVQELKRIGIEKTVMLTGDRNSIAQDVGKKINIDEIHAELLPQDKLEILENIIDNQKGKTAFVGDGINDAPVISRSDVGFAMGFSGSDSAIESADVVLMDDNPLKIAKAIKHSKKCMRIVYENIIFSLGIKIAFLILSAMGITNMWFAVFADVGVMIIAVLNSIRSLKIKSR